MDSTTAELDQVGDLVAKNGTRRRRRQLRTCVFVSLIAFLFFMAVFIAFLLPLIIRYVYSRTQLDLPGVRRFHVRGSAPHVQCTLIHTQPQQSNVWAIENAASEKLLKYLAPADLSAFDDGNLQRELDMHAAFGSPQLLNKFLRDLVAGNLDATTGSLRISTHVNVSLLGGLLEYENFYGYKSYYLQGKTLASIMESFQDLDSAKTELIGSETNELRDAIESLDPVFDEINVDLSHATSLIVTAVLSYNNSGRVVPEITGIHEIGASLRLVLKNSKMSTDLVIRLSGFETRFAESKMNLRLKVEFDPNSAILRRPILERLLVTASSISSFVSKFNWAVPELLGRVILHGPYHLLASNTSIFHSDPDYSKISAPLEAKWFTEALNCFELDILTILPKTEESIGDFVFESDETSAGILSSQQNMVAASSLKSPIQASPNADLSGAKVPDASAPPQTVDLAVAPLGSTVAKEPPTFEITKLVFHGDSVKVSVSILLAGNQFKKLQIGLGRAQITEPASFSFSWGVPEKFESAVEFHKIRIESTTKPPATTSYNLKLRRNENDHSKRLKFDVTVPLNVHSAAPEHPNSLLANVLDVLSSPSSRKLALSARNFIIFSDSGLRTQCAWCARFLNDLELVMPTAKILAPIAFLSNLMQPLQQNHEPMGQSDSTAKMSKMDHQLIGLVKTLAAIAMTDKGSSKTSAIPPTFMPSIPAGSSMISDPKFVLGDIFRSKSGVKALANFQFKLQIRLPIEIRTDVQCDLMLDGQKIGQILLALDSISPRKTSEAPSPNRNPNSNSNTNTNANNGEDKSKIVVKSKAGVKVSIQITLLIFAPPAGLNWTTTNQSGITIENLSIGQSSGKRNVYLQKIPGSSSTWLANLLPKVSSSEPKNSVEKSRFAVTDFLISMLDIHIFKANAKLALGIDAQILLDVTDTLIHLSLIRKGGPETQIATVDAVKLSLPLAKKEISGQILDAEAKITICYGAMSNVVSLYTPTGHGQPDFSNFDHRVKFAFPLFAPPKQKINGNTGGDNNALDAGTDSGSPAADSYLVFDFDNAETIRQLLLANKQQNRGDSESASYAGKTKTHFSGSFVRAPHVGYHPTEPKMLQAHAEYQLAAYIPIQVQIPAVDVDLEWETKCFATIHVAKLALENTKTGNEQGPTAPAAAGSMLSALLDINLSALNTECLNGLLVAAKNNFFSAPYVAQVTIHFPTNRRILRPGFFLSYQDTLSNLLARISASYAIASASFSFFASEPASSTTDSSALFASGERDDEVLGNSQEIKLISAVLGLVPPSSSGDQLLTLEMEINGSFKWGHMVPLSLELGSLQLNFGIIRDQSTFTVALSKIIVQESGLASATLSVSLSTLQGRDKTTPLIWGEEEGLTDLVSFQSLQFGPEKSNMARILLPMTPKDISELFLSFSKDQSFKEPEYSAKAAAAVTTDQTDPLSSSSSSSSSPSSSLNRDWKTVLQDYWSTYFLFYSAHVGVEKDNTVCFSWKMTDPEPLVPLTSRIRVKHQISFAFDISLLNKVTKNVPLLAGTFSGSVASSQGKTVVDVLWTFGPSPEKSMALIQSLYLDRISGLRHAALLENLKVYALLPQEGRADKSKGSEGERHQTATDGRDEQNGCFEDGTCLASFRTATSLHSLPPPAAAQSANSIGPILLALQPRPPKSPQERLQSKLQIYLREPIKTSTSDFESTDDFDDMDADWKDALKPLEPKYLNLPGILGANWITLDVTDPVSTFLRGHPHNYTKVPGFTLAVPYFWFMVDGQTVTFAVPLKLERGVTSGTIPFSKDEDVQPFSTKITQMHLCHSHKDCKFGARYLKFYP